MYHTRTERIGIKFHRKNEISTLSCLYSENRENEEIFVKRDGTIGFLALNFSYFNEIFIHTKFIANSKEFKFFYMSPLMNESSSLNEQNFFFKPATFTDGRYIWSE